MVLPLIGGAASLGLGIIGSRKRARAARRQAGAEEAVRRLSAARERASQIRSASQAIGAQTAAVGGSGVESSSAVTGRASLLNQLSANLTFINQTERLGDRVKEANRLLRSGRKFGELGSNIGGFLGSFG